MQVRLSFKSHTSIECDPQVASITSTFSTPDLKKSRSTRQRARVTYRRGQRIAFELEVINGRDSRCKRRKSRCSPHDEVKGSNQSHCHGCRNMMASMTCHTEVIDALFR